MAKDTKMNKAPTVKRGKVPSTPREANPGGGVPLRYAIATGQTTGIPEVSCSYDRPSKRK